MSNSQSNLDALKLHLDAAHLRAMELYLIASASVSDEYKSEVGELVLAKLSELALHIRVSASATGTVLHQIQIGAPNITAPTDLQLAPWIENLGRACDALIHYRRINITFVRPSYGPEKVSDKSWAPGFVEVTTDKKAERRIEIKNFALVFLQILEPAWRQRKKLVLATKE